MFDLVPRDVLLLIFGQLNARWLKRVALVSRRFRLVSSDDKLWAALLKQRSRSYVFDMPKL